MTYNERYEELKNKAFAEGRKHWRDGDNFWDCGIGYWVADFTTEETAELNALYAAGRAAFEKIEAEKKAATAAKKAADLGMTVEEYRIAKKAEAAKKRAAKRVEELKAELARVAAELEAAEKRLAEL